MARTRTATSALEKRSAQPKALRLQRVAKPIQGLERLCEQLGEVSQLAPILYGLILYHLYRDELASASAVARDYYGWPNKTVPRVPCSMPIARWGSAASIWGFCFGSTHLERALSLYNPVEHRDQAIHYAFDPQVVCLDYLSRTLLPLGYPEQARARHNAALSAARLSFRT